MPESSESPTVLVRWLKENDVAAMTGISLSTLRKHRLRLTGIPFSKLGRSVRYALTDVIRFMDAHRVELRTCR